MTPGPSIIGYYITDNPSKNFIIIQINLVRFLMELPSYQTPSNTLVLVVLVVDGKICIFFFEAKSTDLNKFAVFGPRPD